MNKAIFAALAFLLFFSASAAADARCGVNAYSPTIGLEDCGVDHLDPDDDSLIAEYSSMVDFYANAFPATLDDGDRIKYRLYIKNNLGVPALNNSISCGFWQKDTVNSVNLKSYPYSRNPSRLTLEAGETGYIDILIAINNLIKLRAADSTLAKCFAYNEAVVSFTGSSASGFALEAIGQEIEIKDVELPANNCPTGVCRNIGDTIEIKYKVKNWSAVPLGPFSLVGDIFFRNPFSLKHFGESCNFEEGDVAGEGENFLAADGLAGDEKKLSCAHTISFLEGRSSIAAQARVTGGQTQIGRGYTVPGDAYHFVKISPLSIYNNIAGQLSIEYDIEPEPGTPPMQIFFVAGVQDKDGDPWNKVSEWNYVWSSPGNVEQALVGYNLEDALIPGRKKLRITAFDGIPPDPLPNPPLSFAPNLLDWTTTGFAVPRILQPGNKPYFPGGNIFNLTAGENKLGIRNLYDVSALGESIQYRLSLKEGDPSNVTITAIGCNEGICPGLGPLPLIFTFSERLPEENFDGDGTPYGGIAPGLNTEITMEINEIGTYEFLIEALNDVAGTEIIENTVSEEFGSEMLGASIKKLTAESVAVGEDAKIHIEISEARQPTVKIFDAATNQEDVGASITAPVGAASQDVFYTTTREGSFKVEATIEQPCEACKKTAFFVVTRLQSTPVPEIGLLAVALTALSVVAVIAVKAREK